MFNYMNRVKHNKQKNFALVHDYHPGIKFNFCLENRIGITLRWISFDLLRANTKRSFVKEVGLPFVLFDLSETLRVKQSYANTIVRET